MNGKSLSGGLLKPAAVVAILFGLLSVLAGGSVLFGGQTVAEMAGQTVSFVLWFNFLAGIVYIAAGGGLLFRRRWAVWLSALIALFTGLVFAAFAVHVLFGGGFEMRTVGAMASRLVLWLGITFVAAGTIDWRIR